MFEVYSSLQETESEGWEYTLGTHAHSLTPGGSLEHFEQTNRSLITNDQHFQSPELIIWQMEKGEITGQKLIIS